MSVNKFEENIQKELDALKLAPTAEVWEKVEAQIKKEKKRRFLVLFFISLLVFFTAGLFWLNGKDKQLNTAIKSTDTNARVVSENNIVDVAQNKTIVKNNSSIPQADISVIKTAKTNSKIKSKNKFKIQQQNGEIGTDNATHKLFKKRTTKSKIKFQSKAADIDDVAMQDEKNKDSTSTLIKMELSEKSKTINDSSAKTILLVTKDTTVNKPTDKPIIKAKPATHKWKFGVSFDIGSAARSNGYSQNINGLILSGSSGGGITSGYPGNTPQYNSSAKSIAGVGFGVGAFAEKKISAKTNLSVGLSYRLLSTILKAPQGTPTLFTATGQQLNEYHNYFHFIELPVEVQSKITKQWPLYWSAGVVVSELLSANALQFDASNGHYYYDNNLLHTTNVGLSAGLFFTIGQNGKIPFQIGPAFYYSLTKIANAGEYNRAHYGFAGIRLRKLLTKK